MESHPEQQFKFSIFSLPKKSFPLVFFIEGYNSLIQAYYSFLFWASDTEYLTLKKSNSTISWAAKIPSHYLLYASNINLRKVGEILNSQNSQR